MGLVQQARNAHPGEAASGPLVGFSHHWIDSLDVVATLVTFIVALLQNEGWRGNKAAQRKLNAIASALAELMKHADVDQEHVRQLEAAVGRRSGRTPPAEPDVLGVSDSWPLAQPAARQLSLPNR